MDSRGSKVNGGLKVNGVLSDLRRKSHMIGLTTMAFGAPKQRPKLARYMSVDVLANVKINPVTHGVSLVRAARDGLLEVVEGHLKAGTARIDDVDEDGFTALHHAARYNRVNVLKCLMRAGATVSATGGPEDARPLHLASKYNCSQAVTYLLGQGADVNAPDVKGRTPLHYATRRGHEKIAKMLLSVTITDVDARADDFMTPLHMAAMQGNGAVCEILVSRGASLNARDINDMTPLMWAASEGHVEVSEYLIKSARKHMSATEYVQAADNEGNTALHLAVQNGKIAVSQILLRHNADENGQKLNLATPLHIAAQHGFADIVDLLIAHHADVNKQDLEQMTPMHKAALYNHVDIMQLLMQYGGDINAKDKKNKSPVHCACWKGQTEAVQFLLKNDADATEPDSSLMTALHWVVQYGHYDTLLELLKHVDVALVAAADKNEQTVLHYAAKSGNVTILKTLMEHGGNTAAKDQEERTPLHIAAMHDNLACVDTLIEASPHETNDDDLDGRTPLLLACANGHHMVVQMLLSLGADITNKDDEHRTALMLAAADGHVSVIKLLLENQAAVNEVDKVKNTSLHYACAGGYVDAVQMLLDNRADVSLKNNYDQAPLDLAIDNMRADVANTMLRHKSWRKCLEVRSARGERVLDRLIGRLPDAALIVLDHCLDRSTRDDEDPNLTMVFDYTYIDPGPDDLDEVTNKRYSALKPMVAHGRDKLLSHPLCQNIMSQKWVRYGRTIFITNMCVYVGYLIFLTYYTFMVAELNRTKLYDQVNMCPIMVQEAYDRMEHNDSSLLEYLSRTGTDRDTLRVRHHGVKAVGGMLAFFVIVFFIREFVKMLMQGWVYFFDPYSWTACFLVGTTFVFLHPLGWYPCLMQWRAAWMANFLAWINLMMYIRKIDTLGIYVIMFVAVLGSLLKAILVYFFFCWAFAVAFLINTAGNHSGFDNPWSSILNVLTMTLGEIEFTDNFVDKDFKPFAADVNILLVIFLFIMPIVLMNLMIGVAVGDIEKIQRNAYLKRIALQVELLTNMDHIFPLVIQRRLHVRKATVRPNEAGNSCWQAFRTKLFGSARSIVYIQTEQKDRVAQSIDRLEREVNSYEIRMKSIQVTLQQQTNLLHNILGKLNMEAHGLGSAFTDSLLALQKEETNSCYDNMGVLISAHGAASDIPHAQPSFRKRKSMRQSARPTSQDAS